MGMPIGRGQRTESFRRQTSLVSRSKVPPGRRLLQRREERTVMIVLSDGNSAGHGNAAEIYSHVHKVVADLTKARVELVGEDRSRRRAGRRLAARQSPDRLRRDVAGTP